MQMRKAAVLSLFAVGVASGMAQQPVPAAGTAPSAAIKLNVVVTNGGKGKPVADLKQSDFFVLDNGATQTIQSFRAVSGQAEPVKVLLVIDGVNTDAERIAYERQQLDKFLRANDGQLAQPTALAIFTDTNTVVEPSYSTNGNAIADVLNKEVIGLRELRRSAGFYGAEERLELSLKALRQLVDRAATEPGRKFIVWISPGWPLLSGPNIQLTGKEEQQIFGEVVGFSDALRQGNVTLYALDPLGAGEGPGRTFYYEQFLKGVTRPSQALPGDLGAQVLAVQSGGLFLGNNNDLGILFNQAYADASARYEITYRPPPSEAANTYHHVEVRMAEPRLVARTRQGYYAQP